MPIQFDADMDRDLDNLLCQASGVVHRGARAYSCGELDADIICDMRKLQVDTAELLAFFEDTGGYGSVDMDIRIALRHYEEIASSWLQAVTACCDALAEPEKIAA